MAVVTLTPNDTSWTVPGLAGGLLKASTIDAKGGGGGSEGSVNASGGGGGGAFSRIANVFLQTATTIPVGWGSETTWDNGVALKAESGKDGLATGSGGAGGLAANSIGTTKNNGGAGGNKGTTGGGGGGGVASSSGAGVAGSNGVTTTGGVKGGNGTDGGNNTVAAVAPNTVGGGAGGNGAGTAGVAVAGGSGEITVTYIQIVDIDSNSNIQTNTMPLDPTVNPALSPMPSGGLLNVTPVDGSKKIVGFKITNGAVASPTFQFQDINTNAVLFQIAGGLAANQVVIAVQEIYSRNGIKLVGGDTGVTLSGSIYRKVHDGTSN